MVGAGLAPALSVLFDGLVVLTPAGRIMVGAGLAPALSVLFDGLVVLAQQGWRFIQARRSF